MLKACVIGCGMIADSAHIPAYKYFPSDYFLSAVCDANGESARLCAERHGIKAWYTDAEEMLIREKPDVVSVCVPNFLHKRFSMLSLSYGANVICEKPLAVTAADAVEMYDLARKKGCTLTACQSMRFTPDRLAAKKYIDKYGIGDLYYGEISRIRRRGIPYWGSFHKKSFSLGGAMCDIGVHMLDALVWLCGCPKIESVTAFSGQNHKNELGDAISSGVLTGTLHNSGSFNPEDMDVEDFASGCIRLSGGAGINFKVAWAANLPDCTEIRLVGKAAGILLPEGKVLRGIDEEITLDTEEAGIDSPFAGHYRIIENLASHLLRGTELFVKECETTAVARILEAFEASVRTGDTVRV